MGQVYHSYSFIATSFCKRSGLSGPFHQNCGSFHSAKDLLRWYGGGSLLVHCPWAQPGLGRERETAASTQKQAFSYDPPGKAETSAHDMGWHCSFTCDLDSAKWDTHVGNTLKKSPLSRVTLPSVTPSKPAVARLLAIWLPSRLESLPSAFVC